MALKLLPGIEKATNENLPQVNIILLGVFVAKANF
jgi:hypothetical protein